jgi:Lectin C-type domain
LPIYPRFKYERNFSSTEFVSDFNTITNIEHWTSGKDGITEGNLKWCNGNMSLNVQETNWKGGKPNLANGKCVVVQFSNTTANLTTFSLGDCTQKRKFICEVIKKC